MQHYKADVCIKYGNNDEVWNNGEVRNNGEAFVKQILVMNEESTVTREENKSLL